MVPAGGAHVMHPDCAHAARLLGVDSADAVTGFTFKGRQGTAIINGAVVATEYVMAIEEVIYGLAYEHAQQEEARRSLEALKMWRRLLAGLRIRARIDGYNVEGEDEVPPEPQVGLEDEPLDYEAGGFFPTGDIDAVVDHTATSQHTSHGPHESESAVTSQKAYSEKFSFENHNTEAQEAVRETEWPTFSIKVVYGRDSLTHKERAEANQAKGFMLQDDREVRTVSPPRDISDHITPFSLADDDLTQATMLQQAYESRNPTYKTTEGAVTTSGLKSPTYMRKGLEASDELTVPPAVIDPKQTTAEDMSLAIENDVPARSHDSDSDECSLLSADPEDEDAEPEWLM